MAIAIIDPGHGGTSEVGGSSPNNAKGPNGLLEKDIALDLARRVCSALKGAAVDARLTRDTDRNLGLKARADITRQAGADAFISIHLNGYNGLAQGTETWHHSAASSDSKTLATLVQAAVRKATGLRDRGVRVNAFSVLRPDYHAANTAACLVEVSFMDVALEEARLRSNDYKDNIAAALAGAIKGWLVADGRMGTVERIAVALDERETVAQDGFEASQVEAMAQDSYQATCAEAVAPDLSQVRRRDDVVAAEPIAHDDAARTSQRRAERPVVEADSGDASLPITFLADPGERKATSAAGVENLDGMLRGWRKELLSPPGSDTALPEIIIGRDESLDAVFLALLARRREAVGIIRTEGVDYNGHRGKWCGTGFLVAPNILLTNHHVLNSPAAAQAAQVAFDYELSAHALASGRKSDPARGVSYRLRPDRLFVTSPLVGGLDFSFVWIDDVKLADGALIRMERVAFAVQPNERAFVIHHPGGRPKRVSLDDADIITARPDGAVIHYTSDTEPGSSGAPVFDRCGRLIALHHASRQNSAGIRTFDGLMPHYVNEGIKVAAIALELEARQAREANAMIDMVLGEVYGSDTLTGFFGAAGRQIKAGRPAAERVIELYNATSQDIDLGFWNLGWFADRYDEKVDEVATMVVDLGLDVWALTESSPAATAALAETIERKFGLQLQYLHAEPNATGAARSAAVLWNPATVDAERLRWPDQIDALFDLTGDDIGTGARRGVHPGKIFGRHPALFRFLGHNGGGIDFNLVPLHLDAAGIGGNRRRMATQILARAIDETIQRDGAERDWVLGGAFDAALSSGEIEALIKAGLTPLSAQDEAGGALSYLKHPGSHIEHVFLSPNMSRLHGPSGFFVLAKEKSQVDYLTRFSDHRPVMLRLSARSAKAAPEQRVAPDRALAEMIDEILARAER
ncbi:N-acetylmuramoyl-L-alanine amidase [Massilia soli]|uniref:N-acetylmuramoyl-L-alanine amidase n=1 Tax=Massilia soli TaxID=2792854 RepID=A0ABS7SN59_9BURK|nr:N-acetylmuramoyl-L-alanine amidase [Massilia soli]MBZ2207628.1 N-acetylmuramoyl-L-alanine amidase [Massilia soli]